MSSAEDIAKAAKVAFEASQLIPSDQRISALHAIKRELEAKKEDILSANKEDLQVRFLPISSPPTWSWLKKNHASFYL